MGALSNHPFVKMNGLGNEIVVVDMRARPQPITAAEAREAAVAAPYDQLLEIHPIFPERANISLAKVISRTHVTVRTWERGVGLTQACGSAACAVVVCAARAGRADRKVTVTLPGGDLAIEWREDDHVLMTGP